VFFTLEILEKSENSTEGTVMDLILEVRTGREHVTMACHGKLIGGKEADAFRSNAILLMGGFDKLVINFAGVRAVDCGGLGSLAAVLAAAVDKNRQVRITHACSLIRQMLQVTHLERFLDQRSGRGPQLVPRIRESVA
jgi:ABC-type transporter Mla MlaB component